MQDNGRGGSPALRLNLGCGTDWMGHGVINIDCRNLLPPDGITFLRHDVTRLQECFADGSITEIWAKDVLEHFSQRAAAEILDGWIALLAPGGVLHVKTPDLLALARWILATPVDDEVKAFRIYGGQDYDENFHRAGFTVPMLRARIEARGLTIVEAVSGVETTNLLITARKG